MITEDVVVVFENCESAFISKESVSVLWFGDVTESVSYTGEGPRVMKTAKVLHLVITKPEKSFVERCKKYKDVTQLQIGEEVFHIDWAGDYFDENPRQTNWYYDDHITIRVDDMEEYYD